MWGGSGQDPGGTEGGGTSSDPPSNRELMDLKDQFEQQQVLIAQLKEMLRKTEQTTVTQEKVEEYANTLTRMSARARKSKLKKEVDGKTEVITVTTKKSTVVDTPAKEKLMLLRQQVEENKQKLAERGKFQKGIEETVTQLKAQLDDSQHLISQTPLNLSLSESRIENYSLNSTQEELFNLVVSKDRRLAELTVKVHKLEGNVLDLQENVKEKDSVIDARTKAITLMTESLSKKGKNTLDALDDTKEQMRKMQENFITLEIEMKNEKQQLVVELEQKNCEIERLQQTNNALQMTCNNQQEEITQLNNSVEKYKSDSANSRDLSTYAVTEDLNKQIETLNNRIIELEKLNSELQTKPAETASRESPQRSSKKGKKGQKLQKTKSKESSDDSEAKIAELQKMLDNAKVECDKHLGKITEHELTINELNLMLEELKAKSAVQPEPVPPSEDTTKLKKQLDESNKSMIKFKAQHKSKLKELNKKIDELKKASETSEEVLRLQTENSRLSERIDDLEEEKANLGLDPSCSSSSKDFAATERVKELEIKLLEQSELVDSKNQSISTLEEQIKSHKTEIEALNERFEKLSHLENAQVVSEITSIHFEEQLDKLEIEKRELMQEKEDIIKEKEALLEKLDALNKEKQEMVGKLDSYMQENMELIDKLEKLSAEKVSSAESIEIVEGLTQQEKLELEAYQKSLEMTSEDIKNSDENLEQNPELNESVNQLTEETSDLLRKIELFTEERREVMEKMEALSAENNQLNSKIQEIENNRDILAETYEQLQNDKEDLESQLDQTKEKVKDLETTLKTLKKENGILKGKLDSPQGIKHGSEVEETIKLETVAPLASANEEKNLELEEQISEYKSLVEIQKQEIRELKLQLLSQKDLSTSNVELHERITSLQTQYELLLSENEKLSKSIKEASEVIHEKDAIESELTAARKRISEFDEKLTNNLNEMENYKSIVEENKDELISSANLINELQNKLQEKQNEISHYESEVSHLNSVIAELNSAVSHLENENRQNSDSNDAMERMSDQLQELKALLNENIQQIELYETELYQNSDTISSLNMQLKEHNSRTLELEHDLECKDDEITKLTKERDNKETMIANLQGELKEKDKNFHQVCDTLKEKYLALQTQIEQNAGDLDNMKNPASKVQELETKNKEQLEKMKKIAANLKKKTAAYQELEAKYQQHNEKWETEEKEKVQLQEVVTTQELKIVESQNKIESLLEQLNEMEKEFASVQGTITLKTQEIENLTQDLARLKIEKEDLQNLKQNYELQLNAFTTQAEMHRSDESNSLNVAINEKNEIIRNLNQELEATRYNSQTGSNALHAKIQELEMFIETQEAELTKYKEKVNRLEEGLSTVEERRMSLEQKAIYLGAQLQEKSDSYEEISQTEDILEQRLAALMVHDDKIQRHLQETTMENQELVERNRFLVEENNQLKHKLSDATERNIDASTNQEKVSDLQSENLRLIDVVNNFESENRRLHAEHEKKLNEKKNEVETMETDLQNQMELFDNERKSLMVQCEHLRDQLKEYCETQESLKEELGEYKQKLEQQQVDFDAHILEFQQVSNENKKNLSVIEQLDSQLSAHKSSNQEGAAERVGELEQLLAERNHEIEQYQKQNLQLQMHGSFGQNQPFGGFGDPEQNKTSGRVDEPQVDKNQLAELERINSELRACNSELFQKIELLEKQQTLDSIVTEQPQKAAPEPVSTFVWPEQSDNDPFAFVVNPEVTVQNAEPVVKAVTENKQQAQNPSSNINISENTKEELLNKIKTLEFMLYNTEKEKEDVFVQCQELINEIATLIYERQNVEPSNSTQLEAQICSDKDTALTADERQQLKNVEFVQTRECSDSAQALPVMEEVIEPTATYLCYKPEVPPPDAFGEFPPHLQGHSAVLEPQIVSATDAATTREDLKQLQSLEFERTKPHKDKKDSANKRPVTEDVLEPKTAYVCYQLEAPPDNSHDAQGFQHIQMTPLDSQIVSNQEAQVTSEDLQHLHGVEFEKTKEAKDVANAQAVLEDVAECKTTYLCYKPETAQDSANSQAMANLDIFDENDDGWGCGLEEIKLEEAHRETMGNPLMNLNVNFRIEELDERIHVLEVERERHLEEIKQAQVRSGKLIKKLKEFKALNQKLTADLKKSDFGGLDDAIQDELQSQVARLEKRIKECTSELEKEKTDRSNLLKKVDVLQSANERMVEMKEKQDTEMLSWQRQNRELSAKLEQFEWGTDSSDSPKHEQQSSTSETDINVQGFEKKIQDLHNTIKELTLDNEELQAMLEEQRTLRINADKAKSVEPIPENMKTEAEYLSVVAEKNHLNEQLASNVEEKKNLQEQLNHIIKNNEELQQNLQGLREENSSLEVQITQNSSTIQGLTVQIQDLQNQTQNVLEASREMQNNELEQAKNKISDLEQKNSELTDRLQSLEATTQQVYSENANLAELRDSLAESNQEKTELFNALQEKNMQIEKLNELNAEHDRRRMELEEKLNHSQVIADGNKEIEKTLKLKDVEISEFTNKLESALEERTTLSASIQQLADEWSQRVDQRGADIAESWKLHLDTRESEFAQAEEQLKKEVNELEEKCNALVNENNELRKNVDAEIRNEVDRISALQQQINDRQRYINDLTLVAQENQAKSEQQLQKLSEHEGAVKQLNGQIQDKNVRITEVEAKVLSLQMELEEKNKIIEEIAHKLQDFEGLCQQLNGNQETITSLQRNLNEKQNIIDESRQKLDQLGQYKETCTSLQKQMQDKDSYISEITNQLQEVQTQRETEANDDIQMLQQQVSDFSLQLQEKQMQVDALTQQIYTYQQYSESFKVKDTEINDLKSEIASLTSLLSEKEKSNSELQEKLNLQLKEGVEGKEIEVSRLQTEVNNLKLLLSEKEKEYTYNLATTSQESESVFHLKAQELDAMKRRQVAAENQYEELLMAKDSDVENLRIQHQEQIEKNETLIRDYREREDTLNEFKIQLDLKEQECEELHSRIFEQDALHNEENKQLSEVREIIEDQVLKIESLKQELFEKSKDYDSLIAELDIRKSSRSEPGTPPYEHREEFAAQAKSSEVTPLKHDSSKESDAERANRVELDLALYMLHQRDVRCEELTVELMQLLEERDTLQLKLSNAIREKEEFRSRILPVATTPESTDREITKTADSSTGAIPKAKSKASAIVLGATGTELATEATETLQTDKKMHSLADKLSELKSVGYRRDKTILDEQEHRQLQQMSLMQQHRDVAAMLPAEAAAQLVHDANYTLSRDVQSPPKVLLNWLWGRSTPKVNNI